MGYVPVSIESTSIKTPSLLGTKGLTYVWEAPEPVNVSGPVMVQEADELPEDTLMVLRELYAINHVLQFR